MTIEHTKTTPEAKEEILRRVIQGESLFAICKDEHLPCYSVVFDYFHKHPEFRQAYELAKDESARYDFERMHDIIDRLLDPNNHPDGPIESQAASVALHNMKWILARKDGKKYGDRQVIEHDVSDSLAERIQRANGRIKNDSDKDA